MIALHLLGLAKEPPTQRLLPIAQCVQNSAKLPRPACRQRAGADAKIGQALPKIGHLRTRLRRRSHRRGWGRRSGRRRGKVRNLRTIGVLSRRSDDGTTRPDRCNNLPALVERLVHVNRQGKPPAAASLDLYCGRHSESRSERINGTASCATILAALDAAAPDAAHQQRSAELAASVPHPAATATTDLPR